MSKLHEVRELFVIRDMVAEEDGPIFEANNGKVAWRKFSSLLRENKLNVKDYILYRIGYFEITADGERNLIPEVSALYFSDKEVEDE